VLRFLEYAATAIILPPRKFAGALFAPMRAVIVAFELDAVPENALVAT
jgi:hypothetical protein